MTTNLILLIVSVLVFAAMILLLLYSLRRQRELHDEMQDDLRRALSDLRRELTKNIPLGDRIAVMLPAWLAYIPIVLRKGIYRK